MTDVNGTLYGTTWYGGNTSCGKYAGECGTVFSVTTGGIESVLYNLAGGSDGSSRVASLTNVHGGLYGTTNRGAAHNRGTVYSPSGF